MIVARGLIAGREEHWQVITGRRLAIECIGIQSIQRKLQGGISRRREHGPAVQGGRDGRVQGRFAGGHVHGHRRVGRHRGHDRHRRFGKRRVAGHARDVPSHESGRHLHWHRFIGLAGPYYIFVIHKFLTVYDLRNGGHLEGANPASRLTR